MVANIDNFRTSEIMKGMPAYTAHKINDGYETIYVNNHPLCKSKHFSSATYGTIENAKEECRKFVLELEERGEVYVPKGPNGAPIKGLRELAYGYQVRKGKNNIVYEKSFNDKKKSKAQNLEEALEYINSI